MKLSVIVTVFDIAEELRACMASLLSQPEGDYEILLVDNGSEDGSGELCERYEKEHPGRVRTVRRPDNGGPGAARNTGIEMAKGDFILFVDGDDRVTDGCIRTLLPYTEREFDAVGFDYRVDDHGRTGGQEDALLPYGKTVSLGEHPQMMLSSPCVWNKLWRRTLFTEHGIRFPEGIWYEDLATVPKLYAAAGKMTAVHEELYVYVAREGSITHSHDTERNREIMTASDGLLDWFRAEGLFSAFRSELEALCVRHVLLVASVRVLRDGPYAPLLDSLLDHLEERFPDWRDNPYVKAFPARHRWILRQLAGRRYRAVRTLFLIRDALRAGRRNGRTG